MELQVGELRKFLPRSETLLSPLSVESVPKYASPSSPSSHHSLELSRTHVSADENEDVFMLHDEEATTTMATVEEVDPNENENIPNFLQTKLLPHQKKGFTKLSEGNAMILADFMGLGKTLQVASFLTMYLSDNDVCCIFFFIILVTLCAYSLPSVCYKALGT